MRFRLRSDWRIIVTSERGAAMVLRRILAVPLALVVAIAVFISPVLATEVAILPQYMLTFSCYSGSNLGTPDVHTAGVGSFSSFALTNSSSENYRSTLYFDGYDQSSDLYIAVNTTSIPYLNLGSLQSYYVSSGNIVSDVSVTTTISTLTYSSSSPTVQFSTNTQNITFMCFRGVPSGTVIQIINDNPAYPGGSVGTYLSSGSARYPLFTYGIFYSSIVPISSGILDDYLNGSISFDNALDQIYDLTGQNVSASVSSEGKILQLLLGQQEIDHLIQLSDDKSLSSVTNGFLVSLRSIISDYLTGTSLSNTLSYMHYELSNALRKCDTSEQGQLVYDTYLMALDELSFRSNANSLDKLNSAISDDQLTEADDYYASEEDLIDQFELAEFESALDFELWFNTLPPPETSLYKQFFDYLLNDSSIRMFLIVPISLILVRILMGTHLVLGRGGDHSSKTTVFDSADHYHFYDDGFRGS